MDQQQNGMAVSSNNNMHHPSFYANEPLNPQNLHFKLRDYQISKKYQKVEKMLNDRQNKLQIQYD